MTLYIKRCHMKLYESVLSENGRIIIPSSLRKLKGYKTGQKLSLIADKIGIRVVTQEEALTALQELAKAKVPKGHSLSEELIADRKKDYHE